MSKKRVVVADVLGNVRSALKERGYEVLDMSGMNQNPDAVIISGLDDNMLGMSDTHTKAPVIDANGLSAKEVLDELEERMGRID